MIKIYLLGEWSYKRREIKMYEGLCLLDHISSICMPIAFMLSLDIMNIHLKHFNKDFSNWFKRTTTKTKKRWKKIWNLNKMAKKPFLGQYFLYSRVDRLGILCLLINTQRYLRCICFFKRSKTRFPDWVGQIVIERILSGLSSMQQINMYYTTEI